MTNNNIEPYNERPLIIKKQKRTTKAWHFFIFFLFITLTVLSGIIFNILIKKIQNTKNELEIITNTLYQVIDSNHALTDALEIETEFYELELHSQKTNDAIIPSDTIELVLDEVYKTYQDDLYYLSLSEFLVSSYFNTIAKTSGSSFIQKNNVILFIYKDIIVATFQALFNTSTNDLESFSIQSEFTDIQYVKKHDEDLEIIINTIKDTVDLNIKLSEQFLKSFKEALADTAVTNLVKQYNLSIEHNTSLQYIHKTAVNNRLNETIVDITLDSIRYTVNINGTVYSKSSIPKKRSTYAIDTILNSSYLSKQETINFTYLEKMKKTINSKEVQANLHKQNLIILTDWRMDNDYYYFDINTNSKHPYPQIKMGSLAFQRSNGQLWLMDKDDIVLRNISYPLLIDQTAKEKLFLNESQNILIIGTHNDLADTLILAHINSNNSIKLLGIPRDMYYKGNKINWYYKFYTHENFLRTVEEMLGLIIADYVSIDMYAFISVIDKIGGIIVHLEQDLIDPSYKIKENGKWSYVNYSKGTYHLDGLEVLRIARSRNSTNDFSRSRRQQIILEAIRNKINNLDIFSSMLSLMQIVSEIKPYITTNLNVFEIVTLIAKNKDSPLQKKLTLSTSNILQQTYTKLYTKKVKDNAFSQIQNSTQLENTDNNGAYILVPQNNDWNALRLFVRNYIIE